MPASVTHNSIVLRPPPGTRFTVWGSDVHLEFERGREKEVYDFLSNWIDCYILPEAIAHDKKVRAEAAAAKPVNLEVSFPFNLKSENTENGKSEE